MMQVEFHLSVIIILNGVFGHVINEGWHWFWTCDYRLEKCQRNSDVGLNSPDVFNYDSLQTCRLVCGQYGALWPKPTISTALQRDLIPFHPDAIQFSYLNANDEAKSFLIENTNLFKNNIWAECGRNCSKVPDSKISVLIQIISSDLSLQWGTNESYHLQMTSEDRHISCHIFAQNVFGARHGLETLTQLIAQYPIFPNIPHSTLKGLVILSGANIHDKPAYLHRGLLLDTSRNFLPIRIIKKQIDGMSSVKLNVLHWHATDSQSFPLISTRVPQMARYGAYSEDMMYSPSEVENLLQYAKLRGIRIILEIDTPSHSGFGWQWGTEHGLGNLAVCVNKTPWRSYCIQPPCGQLNPSNPNLYTVLGSIYKDFIEIFPNGEAFHMGGDEIFIECWNSSTEIVEYLKQHGKGSAMKDFYDLWGEFQLRALNEYDKIVGNAKTPIIVWSSALTDPEIIAKYLPYERFIIQTWVPSTDKLPEKLLEMGYKLIISTKDAWYLDHGFFAKTQYHTWRTVYMNRLPPSKNVLGGEVCMWGEYVDENGLDNKIWPRAAAAAERLWSDPAITSSKAETRLYAHRERLVSRGFSPEVLTPYWCYQNEVLCT